MAHGTIGQTTIAWKRSNPLLKVILAVLIVFSIAAMTALGIVGADLRRQNRQMQQEALELETENEGLERRIDALGSESSVRQIAKEELGMVESGTVLLQPEAAVK